MSEISFIFLQDLKCLKVNYNEVKRYLKINGCTEALDEIMLECEKEVYKFASPKAVYLETRFEAYDSTMDFCFGTVKSENLSKNLYGCKKAYIFCATLGAEIDILIKRYSQIEPSKALIIDSISSALVESFCDYINDYMGKEKSLCPRFSCGYGDFSIEHQGAILNVLDASRKIGVSLMESHMMTPSKTVTAIVGIK